MGVYVGDNLVAGNVGEVYSKAQVDAMIANAVALAEPTGSIKPFAGTTIPDGYLLCDGSAVSRRTYAALFAVIGTTYGTGDGSTTFNLPDKYTYTGRVMGNRTAVGFQNPNGYGGLISYIPGNVVAAVGIEDYGKPISTTNTTTSFRTGTLGLSDQPEKSGIICEKDAQLKLCIKY